MGLKNEGNELDWDENQHKERMRLFNEGYRRLSENAKAWCQELDDRRELEGTLADGLNRSQRSLS